MICSGSREATAGGIDFLVGFESEFVLLRSMKSVEPLTEHDPLTTKAFIAGSPQEKVLEEICDGIKMSGIELQLYHAEGAPGQVKTYLTPSSS